MASAATDLAAAEDNHLAAQAWKAAADAEVLAGDADLVRARALL